MSIMLHNFDTFGIDYNDFTSSNWNTMSAHISQSTTSYKIVDFVSWFYGICNVAISILDSISDIAFIISLLFYSGFQQHAHVANTFLVLTMGNMLSVAIVISLYVCYHSTVKSWLKIILQFMVCLIFSPFLASFKWLLKKLEIRNNDLLVVNFYINQDATLLWFQQELITNKLFLIEAAFESYFQVIIQLLAIFQFQDLIAINIYLYISIFISLVVIMSKLILIPYNAKKAIILINLLYYFMDIFFALIM
eukprot:497354_1